MTFLPHQESLFISPSVLLSTVTEFQLVSSFPPAGSQPEAIAKLNDGLADNIRFQTLLGVTGSGKTFTMANVIAAAKKPTLVIAHNKTLAAQLYQEFCDFFPKNRVEYFVSYYDYYQPESYIPAKDQYIEKDSAINPKIEMLRLSATASSRAGAMSSWSRRSPASSALAIPKTSGTSALTSRSARRSQETRS